VPVVRVLAVDDTGIEVARLPRAEPTPVAAEEFGRRLAATHAAGADGFGRPPPGWSGDGWIGTAPLPLPAAGPGRWPEFFAGHRLDPYLRTARDHGRLSAEEARVVAAAIDRIAAAEHQDEPPARLHGDLWSGNVLMTPAGATLVDPAAHGGHRETDLAMLALFGLPHLDRALAAYDEAAPLATGWRERVPMHQLHPLLVHVVLFGGGYAAQAVAAARRC
jgi:fructosamine-3-kinase